jgi:hypothetical protein
VLICEVLNNITTNTMKPARSEAEAQLTAENWLQCGSIVLKLVLQALGPGCYLPVSLVCKDWRDAYLRDVQHGSNGPETACQPHLETAAAWMRIKAHGLHKSIPAVCIGQYACDTVLIEHLGHPHASRIACLKHYM